MHDLDVFMRVCNYFFVSKSHVLVVSLLSIMPKNPHSIHIAPPEGEANSELLFVYSHAISDGTGSLVFFRDLFEYYARISHGDLTVIPEPQPLPIIEPIRTIFPQGVPTFDSLMIGALMPLVRSQLWEEPRLPWQRNTPSHARYSRFLFASGTDAGLAHLLVVCKKRNVTVGTFLNTAVMWALGRQYQLLKPNKPLTEVSLLSRTYYRGAMSSLRHRKKM